MLKYMLILMLFVSPVFAQDTDNQTLEPFTDDYEVDDIGEVEIIVTTPYDEIVTLNDLDWVIAYKLEEFNEYRHELNEIVKTLYEVKKLRDKVKAEAMKVKTKTGDGI